MGRFPSKPELFPKKKQKKKKTIIIIFLLVVGIFVCVVTVVAVLLYVGVRKVTLVTDTIVRFYLVF